MLTSRRTLVAGLAALTVIATTAAAKATLVTPKFTTRGEFENTVDGQDDPIFFAIERHRDALTALEDMDEDADPEAYAEAEQEIAASYDALLATVPQTIAGCRALVDHLIDDVGVDVDEALSVLREALDRIATAT